MPANIDARSSAHVRIFFPGSGFPLTVLLPDSLDLDLAALTPFFFFFFEEQDYIL